LPSLERSVIATTTSLFLRDPQQIMPVATITIMMALFPFLMGRSRPGPIIGPSVLLQSFAALSFIGSMNLALNATVIDGRNFWMILCSPHSAARKLFSKLLVSAFFFVPLASAAAIAFRVAGVIGWTAVPRAIWFATCMTFVGGSIGVLLALTYGDWEWEIPKRMLKTMGRLIMLGVMGAFFAGTAIMLAATSASGRTWFLNSGPLPVFTIGSLLAAVLTYVFLRLASGRMESMEWTL
jgi:hypothetical protein